MQLYFKQLNNRYSDASARSFAGHDAGNWLQLTFSTMIKPVNEKTDSPDAYHKGLSASFG